MAARVRANRMGSAYQLSPALLIGKTRGSAGTRRFPSLGVARRKTALSSVRSDHLRARNQNHRGAATAKAISARMPYRRLSLSADRMAGDRISRDAAGGGDGDPTTRCSWFPTPHLATSCDVRIPPRPGHAALADRATAGETLEVTSRAREFQLPLICIATKVGPDCVVSFDVRAAAACRQPHAQPINRTLGPRRQ